MRVKFLKPFDVDLKDIPPESHGATRRRHETDEDGIHLHDGIHHFPAGREAEVSEEMAARLIADGTAEKAVNVVIWGEAPSLAEVTK